MTILILTETPAGYGLFRLKNKKLLNEDKDVIAKAFADPETAGKNVEMKAFCKFKVSLRVVCLRLSIL